MDQEYVTREQAKRIQRYVDVMSRRAGHDLGETGCLEWVDHYAKAFRKLVEVVPRQCIGCGYCDDPAKQKICPSPLNERRLRLLRRNGNGKEKTRWERGGRPGFSTSLPPN